MNTQTHKSMMHTHATTNHRALCVRLLEKAVVFLLVDCRVSLIPECVIRLLVLVQVVQVVPCWCSCCRFLVMVVVEVAVVLLLKFFFRCHSIKSTTHTCTANITGPTHAHIHGQHHWTHTCTASIGNTNHTCTANPTGPTHARPTSVTQTTHARSTSLDPHMHGQHR